MEIGVIDVSIYNLNSELLNIWTNNLLASMYMQLIKLIHICLIILSTKKEYNYLLIKEIYQLRE